MFSGKEQAQYEHIQYLQQRLSKQKSSSTPNLLVLFVVFAALGYAGTQSIALGVVFGFLATIIRGAAYDVIREQLLAEHNRALCDFDGDLEELQEKLNFNKEVFLKRRRILW